MRVHIRSRAILLLSVGTLLVLQPRTTSAVESKSAGEFIVTSPAALSHAALTGLITDAFGNRSAVETVPEVLDTSADQARTSDCPASNTQLSFDTCFSVPSLHPAGYVFIPQISASNGELYWQFVARPVSAAGIGFPRLD
jgi:hypothetical protein